MSTAMSSKIPGFYTAQEAANILECSLAQVTRYCKKGSLAAKNMGRMWLIEQAEVHTFKRPKRGNPNFGKAS